MTLLALGPVREGLVDGLVRGPQESRAVPWNHDVRSQRPQALQRLGPQLCIHVEVVREQLHALSSCADGMLGHQGVADEEDTAVWKMQRRVT